MSRRVLVAFAVAPMAPVLLMGAIFLPLSPVIVVLMAPFCYGVALVFGIPLHMLMVRAKLTKFWWYLALGYATTFFISWAFWKPTEGFQAQVLSLFGGLGALGALVFWWIARPDLPPTGASEDQG